MGKDCDATYSFQTFPNRSALRLMLNISVKEDLTMQLVRGPCWVNCSGGDSECEVTVTHHKWSPPQNSVDLIGMPPGNYCVRVSCHECYTRETLQEINCSTDCCVVCTQTEELTAFQNEISVFLKIPTTQFFILGFLLTICVVLLIIVLFIRKKGNVMQIQSNESSCKSDDDAQNSVDVIKKPSVCNILLLYSMDSTQFCKAIECLRRFITKLDNVQVYDYIEELQTRNGSRNIVEWLSKYLQHPNNKIVLVISEGAVMQQQALLRKRRILYKDPHHLNSMFSYALCYLHNNYTLSRNYERIISIRFEDIVGDKLILSFIVPLKCFVLMKHIEQFIMEIQGVAASYDHCLDEYTSFYFSEIQDLANSLMDIKHSMKEKSNTPLLDWM